MFLIKRCKYDYLIYLQLEDKVKEIVLEKKIEERENDKNQLFKRKNEINTKNKLKVNILCVKNYQVLDDI